MKRGRVDTISEVETVEQIKPPATLAEQMQDRVDNPPEDVQKDKPVHKFLSSGCAVVNLAISDRIEGGGWPCGRISQIKGPSDFGKSAFGTMMLAEGAQDKNFDGYRLIDLDMEFARSDESCLFGKRYQERVEHWFEGNTEFPFPRTVEEVHYVLLELFENKQPFIMLIDTLDFLPSKQALEESGESLKNWQKGKKDESGSYNMAKQKYMKKMLGEIAGKIGQTESIILLVSQLIDNVSAGYGEKHTISTGGRAVGYATRVQARLASAGGKDTARDEVVGRYCSFQVEKNHITFKRRDAEYWIYEGMGIDDVRSSVDFLISHKHWTKDSTGRVNASEFPTDKKLTVRELVRHIDQGGHLPKLNRVLQRFWNQKEKDIADFIFKGRERRYL